MASFNQSHIMGTQWGRDPVAKEEDGWLVAKDPSGPNGRDFAQPPTGGLGGFWTEWSTLDPETAVVGGDPPYLQHAAVPRCRAHE